MPGHLCAMSMMSPMSVGNIICTCFWASRFHSWSDRLRIASRICKLTYVSVSDGQLRRGFWVTATCGRTSRITGLLGAGGSDDKARRLNQCWSCTRGDIWSSSTSCMCLWSCGRIDPRYFDTSLHGSIYRQLWLRFEKEGERANWESMGLTMFSLSSAPFYYLFLHTQNIWDIPGLIWFLKKK